MLMKILMVNMNTVEYPFYNYICGVTGLTCCGCSLFCEHMREKMLIDKIKKIRKQYGFPLWLIREALEYYDEDENKAIDKLIEMYSAIGDHPDIVVKRNIENFMNEVRSKNLMCKDDNARNDDYVNGYGTVADIRLLN